VEWGDSNLPPSPPNNTYEEEKNRENPRLGPESEKRSPKDERISQKTRGETHPVVGKGESRVYTKIKQR